MNGDITQMLQMTKHSTVKYLQSALFQHAATHWNVEHLWQAHWAFSRTGRQQVQSNILYWMRKTHLCERLTTQAYLVEQRGRLKDKSEQCKKTKTRHELKKVNNCRAKFAKTSSWPTFSPDQSRCIKLWSVWARVKGEEERQSKQIAIQSSRATRQHWLTSFRHSHLGKYDSQRHIAFQHKGCYRVRNINNVVVCIEILI